MKDTATIHPVYVFSDDFAMAGKADGKIYLLNNAGYLIDKRDAVAMLTACQEYLSHIDQQTIDEHNRQLIDAVEKLNSERANNRMQRTALKATFIYIMFNSRNGFYKIGRSKLPSKRERTLQAEEPEIEIIYSFLGTSQTEQQLHLLFNCKRIRGEWFSLAPADIEYIKSLYPSKSIPH